MAYIAASAKFNKYVDGIFPPLLPLFSFLDSLDVQKLYGMVSIEFLLKLLISNNVFIDITCNYEIVIYL